MSDRLRNYPAIVWENIAVSEAADRRAEHRRHLSNVTPKLAQDLADISFAYPSISGGAATGMALAGIAPLSPEAEIINDRNDQLTAAGLTPPPERRSFWDLGLTRPIKDFARGALTMFESFYDEVVKGTTSMFYSLGQDIEAGTFGFDSFERSLDGSFGMSPSALGHALRQQGINVNTGSGFLLGGDLAPETQALLDQGVPFIEAIKNPAQMELGVPLRQYSDYVRNKNARVVAGSENIADPRTGQKGLQITPGRVLASVFTEPGTKPFNHFSGVGDVAANIFLDPANKVPFKYAEDVGGLNRALVGGGHRGTVLTRNVDDWLASSHGTRTAQYFADLKPEALGGSGDDFLTLYGLFRKNATRSNVDANFISTLYRTDNVDDVKSLLSTLASGGSAGVGQLAELPVKQSLVGRATGSSGLAGTVARGLGFGGDAVDVGGLRHALTRNRAKTSWVGRMGAEVGATALRVDDISGSVDDFGQWLKAAGFEPERIGHYMGEMASMQNGGIENGTVMWGIVSDAYKELGTRLKDAGINQHVADAFTQVFNGVDDYRKYWLNNAGNPQMFAGSKFELMAGGQLVAIPTGQLFSEFMDWAIPLLDMRKIRKGIRRKAWADAGFETLAGKKVSATLPPGKALPRFKLDDMDGWEDLGPSVAGSLINASVQKVWKPLVLLRVAWPVRVLAEEQVRMMAAGMDSLWNHPLNAIMMSFGDKIGVTRQATDVKGNVFSDAVEFRNAMSKRGLEFGLGRQRSMFTNEWLKVKKGDPRYWDGWAIELQQLTDDPIVARIAKALRDEPDPSVRVADLLKPIKDEFAGDETTELGKLRKILAADSDNWDLVHVRAASDAVIDDRYRRLVQKTGGETIGADHIRGEWADDYGQVLHATDDHSVLLNPRTGSRYTLEDPPVRDTVVKPLGAVNPATQRAFDDLAEPFREDLVGLLDDGRLFDNVDPQVMANEVERLDRFIRTEMFGYDTELYTQYLDLSGLVTRIERNRDDLIAGTESAVTELRHDLQQLEPMLNRAQELLRPGVDIDGVPIARASQNALELIEASGNPTLVRQRFSGYRPRPGQPSLDEIANKQSWTVEEMRDLLGPGVGKLSDFPVHRVPQEILDSVPATDGVRIWTTPGTFGETYNIGHGEWVTGELSVVRDQHGTIDNVSMFRVTKPGETTMFIDEAGDAVTNAMGRAMRSTGDVGLTEVDVPGSKFDAGRLMGHLLKQMEGDEAQMLDLAFGGVPIREWLTSAGHSDLVAEGAPLLGINDIAEFMRAQYGAAWAGADGPLGKMPAISLSHDGASLFASQLLKTGRREGGRLRAAAMPQQHMTVQATRHPKFELLDAIAEGKLGKVTLSARDLLDDAEKVSRVSQIAEVLREGWEGAMDDLPEFTKVAKPADTKRMDGVVDHLFDMLMSRPTNRLSRSPAFRQFYWRRIAELYPHADGATQQKILAAASDAGFGGGIRGMVDNLLSSSDEATGGASTATRKGLERLAESKFDELTGAIDNLDDLDEIAKAFALQETKRLLYDLTKKTQFFDMTRNVFPFGEAWHEIITTWARLFNENPHLFRRLQQGIEGARQEGIFYPDPATGEEIFAMPHMDWMAKVVGISEGEHGADGALAKPQFSGRVEGVNLMLNNYLPGLGPLVQMPMASFARGIMDDPDLRWVRDLVFPYGYPDAENPGAIVNSVMPAWFRKALTGIGRPTGDDQRLFNNTVIDVLRAMEINEEITDGMNTEDVSKLLEEAQRRARKIFLIRSLQQFVGPTGAQVRWDVKLDPGGEAFAYQVLATEYRQMIEEHRGDRVQAFHEFTNQFGFDPAGIATAKTESLRPRSVTEAGLDFEAANEELFDRYSLTAYYAAPDKPDGAFDYNAYLAQLRDQDRVGITPEQWATERNRLLGSISYEKLRRAAVDAGIRNDPRVASYLRSMRYHFMEVYPGYGFDNIGVPSQPEQGQFHAEFERWRTDPQLSRTQAGEGLGEYLNRRDRVLALAEVEYGVSRDGFATAKSTAQLRQYLLQSGQHLTTQYPDFGVIFQRHYLWEVEDPEPVAPTSLLGVDLGGGT